MDRRGRPRPLGAILLVASGASLLVIYGILAVEVAEALFATSPPGFTYTCVGTCASTQATAVLGAGFLLCVTAWWMYRRPRYHVAEGLLVCIMAAACEVVVLVDELRDQGSIHLRNISEDDGLLVHRVMREDAAYIPRYTQP